MPNCFPFRVHGYNIANILYGQAVLGPAGTLVFTLTGGPGEVLGFGIFKYAGTVANFDLFGIKYVIDGITIFDSGWGWLLGLNAQYSMHGLFSTNDIQDANFSAVSFLCRQPFDSTHVMTITNNSAANVSIIGSEYYRFAG